MLGYDTERSTDHGWGPHLHVFVDADEVERGAGARSTRGSRGTSSGGRRASDGTTSRRAAGSRCSRSTSWLPLQLRLRPAASADRVAVAPAPAAADPRRGRRWACSTTTTGELTALRERARVVPGRPLALAARMPVAAHRPGGGVRRAHRARSATTSGRRCIAARLARDLMRLCFLIERRYAPYSKWFGTAFAELDAAAGGRAAARGGRARARRTKRSRAVTTRSASPIRVDPTLRPYYGRPFHVIFARALRGGVPRARARIRGCASLPPHRRDRPVVRLDRRALDSPRCSQRLAAALRRVA